MTLSLLSFFFIGCATHQPWRLSGDGGGVGEEVGLGWGGVGGLRFRGVHSHLHCFVTFAWGKAWRQAHDALVQWTQRSETFPSSETTQYCLEPFHSSFHHTCEWIPGLADRVSFSCLFYRVGVVGGGGGGWEGSPCICYHWGGVGGW